MKVHKITLTKSIIKHYKYACEYFGDDWDNIPKYVKRKVVDQKIKGIQEILDNGLDIGGIKKSVIPVTLVKDNDHGLCFYSENRVELFKIWIYLS